MIWPMGKIVKIYRNRDGGSGVIQMEISSGYLTSPIEKIFPIKKVNWGDSVLTLTFKTNLLLKSCKKYCLRLLFWLVGCRIYGRLSHERSRPMGEMPSVGVFLRIPSPYLREFRKKSRKTPNG